MTMSGVYEFPFGHGRHFLSHVPAAAEAVIGGTSAVSPLWAGLITLINQKLSSLGKPHAGFINPLVYKMTSTSNSFHDIVQGNNDVEGLGKYKAGKNWDACTGLGTPDGTKLMTALGG